MQILLHVRAFSKVLKEEDLSDETLSTAVFDLYKNREAYINTMEKAVSAMR